ncbi:MAG: pyridoxal phosphate-dependent aminotransferase [Halobacteriaceae archaeon]
MNLAERVTRVDESATLAVSNAARRLRSEGADVVDLSVGEPDFDTPEPIRAAGKAAIDAGETGYTQSTGIPALRDAITAKLDGDGIDVDPDQVIVTPGAKHALYITIQSLIDTGDEVVLLDPSWVSYAPMVTLAGGTARRLDLTSHGFALEPALDDLESMVSTDTQAVVVNTPNNPTGQVYSPTALEGLRDLVVEYDLTVIADEIYREITYGDTPPSLGSLPDMGERTVTINGFSKAYAMTGWRLGYLAGPRPLVEQAKKVQSHSVTCATNFVQNAGITALTEVEDRVDAMVAAFEDRRDLLVDRLATHGVNVTPPDGAFYLMLPVDADDRTWCETVIEDVHVATVPGSAFGAPGYARLSYANSTERLREGIDRLAAGGYL